MDKGLLLFVLFILLMNPLESSAQTISNDSVKNGFYAHFEVRPRAEYTANYALPPNDSITPFLMVTVRNRLSMDYVRPKWMVRSEFQEIHYWDDHSKVSKVGSVNFYQLFFESKFQGVNLRGWAARRFTG